MDIASYALSKKIAEHAVSGVQSMSVNGQTLIINTKDSGVLTMTFPTPKDGVSVTDIDVNANNQIVFTMSDGTEFISGKIPTVKGDAGFSPTITENADNTDKIYKLDITTADSTFTTPNLKGGKGGSGEENKIDSISVNGVNIVPDENKNVDITVPTVTNDLTDELKSLYDDAVTEKHTHDNKIVLDNITAEKVESWNKAEENVQSDWNETDDTADGFIKNKPTIPDAYDDTALSGRVDDVETSIGDMSLIEVKSVSDLVSAINTLYNAFMSSINYANKKLTITYRNGGTVDIDMSAIITDTNIGELSNIDDTGITDKQILSYDTATNKYIPTTIDTAGVLADAKKYTDDEIAKINNADAISVDEKPTYSNGTITYKKDGVEKTITDGDFWFFYTVDDMAYQTIWIDDVEFTTSVDGSVDFKDFVSKTNDLTSTYTGEETDKTKVTTIASLDALYAIISTALGKKVNTADIVDNLSSDATDKPLSAAQGKVLDTKISNFVTTIEEDYAKTTDIPTTLPANGGNADTVNNHTVETDVPVDAVFIDTIYDDTEVKESIEELNSNLSQLELGEVAGGKQLHDGKIYHFYQNVANPSVCAAYDNADSIIFETANLPNIITVNANNSNRNIVCYYDTFPSPGVSSVTNITEATSGMPKNITVDKTHKYILIELSYGQHVSNIMVNEGSTSVSYEPYIPSVKMLAEENAQQHTEAMDLKMLGWTVPSECPIQNYVDGNGVFHQRVGRVDLGSLDWRKNEDSVIYAHLINKNLKCGTWDDNIEFTMSCSKFKSAKPQDVYLKTSDDKTMGAHSEDGIKVSLVINDSSYTDATAFKNAMHGVYLYYEFETEQTISVDGNEAVTKANESFDTLEFGEVAGGKNLFKYNEVSGTLSKTVEYSLDVGTYTISALVNSSDTDSSTSLIDFYYEDGTNESYLLGRESRTSYTITLTKHVIALVFYASTDWANSANDTFTYSDIQIEKGTTATDYEPYIPSVKMLADEVSAQNDSLEDYGLNNVFDDEYKDGFYENDGKYYYNAQWKTTKNSLIVSSENLLSINLDSSPTYARIVYFDDSNTFVSYENFNGVKNAKLKVPSGATKCYISMFPNTRNIESIYVDNAIDSIKNDLIVLETTSTIDMTASRELDDITSSALTIPSGYKPIAMYGYNLDNNDNVFAMPLLIRSDGKVLFHAKNHSTSDQGIIHFVIRVTLKKLS